MDASFEDLRRVQLLERNSPGLTQVSSDFYSAYREFLRSQKSRLEADYSSEGAATLKNCEKLLREVFKRRQRKLFIKALSDFQSGAVDSEGLAEEEKGLYTSAVKILVEQESAFDSIFALQRKDKRAGETLVEVTIVADLPQFVGSAGPLGPFSASQKVRLSARDARTLVEQGVALEEK